MAPDEYAILTVGELRISPTGWRYGLRVRLLLDELDLSHLLEQANDHEGDFVVRKLCTKSLRKQIV